MKLWDVGFRAAIVSAVMVGPAIGQTSMTDPREFKASDFLFYDAFGQKWAKVIIKGVNMVAHENSECVKIDPSSADLAGEDQESKANPKFFVTCQNAQGRPFNVEFTAQDVMKNVALGAEPPISQREALAACRRGAIARATHPSTVSFPWFSDTDFTTFPGGKARLELKVEAKNSFDLKLTYRVSCYFAGPTMSEIDVSEVKD